MAWTYSALPETSDRDAVRLLIGDTDTTDQQLQDSEIAFYLTEEGNNYFAAAMAARSIASKYARLSDKSVGDLRISYAQRQQHYLELALSLESRAAVSAGTPFAGGISEDQKETENQREDRITPQFWRGKFENTSIEDADFDRTVEDS